MTLDKDVERMLHDAMHRSRRTFKETLNAAVRAGLRENVAPQKSKPFIVEARPMGLRAGIDPAGLNKLVDDLEIDAFLEKTGRVEANDHPRR